MYDLFRRGLGSSAKCSLSGRPAYDLVHDKLDLQGSRFEWNWSTGGTGFEEAAEEGANIRRSR